MTSIACTIQGCVTCGSISNITTRGLCSRATAVAATPAQLMQCRAASAACQSPLGPPVKETHHWQSSLARAVQRSSSSRLAPTSRGSQTAVVTALADAMQQSQQHARRSLDCPQRFTPGCPLLLPGPALPPSALCTMLLPLAPLQMLVPPLLPLPGVLLPLELPPPPQVQLLPWH